MTGMNLIRRIQNLFISAWFIDFKMAQFVALLSTGKGSWAEVAALMNRQEFDEIFLLTNTFGKEKFTNLPQKKVEIFSFDFEKDVISLSKDFFNVLKPHIKFGDVAINLSSGSGKEHMALLSAMIKLGMGLRIVTYGNNDIVEL